MTRRADRRHDRDRRLARHRDGRGRPVSAPLYDRIQEVRDALPRGPRSAVIPALRLAQEQYGWLSPDAFREVADALDLTPAYCHVGRVVLRHVPPRAGRRAHGRGLHERLVRALRRAGGARGVRGRARLPRRRDDATTARSRCGRSSASAAAAGGRSSRSTAATASTSSRSDVPGDRRGAARVSERPQDRPGGRRRARPDEARRVPGGRRLRRRSRRRAR